MKQEFDLSKEYGIVLEGGGAKGAYQIGVWKAFLECGVKIKGVSGVSVGALNGALMCMGDYQVAEDIWSDITYSTVMKVNNEQMDRLMNHNLKELDLKELTKDTTRMLAEGGIDITPLKDLIDKWIDEDKVQNSDIEFIMGTFEVSKLKEVEILAKEAEKSYLKDYLLASAYLPAFRNEKLHGVKYLDGGMFNNVPVNMLLNRGYKDIIIVRIYGIGLEKRVKIPKDVNIIQIAPRVDLGGILEFDCKKSKRNIKIGYFDGLRCVRSLKGKIYYIDSKLEDEDCIKYLIAVNEAVKMALLEYYKVDYSISRINTRKFIDTVCPRLASSLKLNKEWNYVDLYLALLELCAKSLKIPKYTVYSEEELISQIKEKYGHLKELDYKFPLFHELILKLVTI